MSKTAITLYSGAGVADCGLKSAGFNVVAAVERDPKIAEIYRANHGDHVLNCSVGEADLSQFEGIDLLFLSPPCQSDSIARNKNLPSHPDRLAGLEAIKQIKILKPKFIVLECVPGYTSNPAFWEIRENLYLLGYWGNELIIDCADFGVPQRRRRLIARYAAPGCYVPSIPLKESWRGWEGAIADLLPDCQDSTLADWQVEALERSGIGKKLLPPASCLLPLLLPREGANTKNATPIGGDRPSPTVRSLSEGHSHLFDALDTFGCASSFNGADTSLNGGNPRNGLAATSYKTRLACKQLSVRCLARLQTIPDSFSFEGVGKGWAVRAIGNGFPSLAMQKISEQFL